MEVPSIVAEGQAAPTNGRQPLSGDTVGASLPPVMPSASHDRRRAWSPGADSQLGDGLAKWSSTAAGAEERRARSLPLRAADPPVSRSKVG